MSIDFSGSATDPLGASATDALSITPSGADGTRTIRRTLFENRVLFSSPTPGFTWIEAPTLGPDGDNITSFAGPLTVGVKFWMERDCNITAVRFYKHPGLTGSVPVGMWDAGGTLLASTTSPTYVADAGGWVEVALPSPVAVVNGGNYAVGYNLPGSAGDPIAWSPWVWNAQDYVSYPFEVRIGGGMIIEAPGNALTWVANPFGSAENHNYYVEPVAEWDVTTPEYTGGTGYFSQFGTGGSRHAFPVGIFFSDPNFLAAYWNEVGLNTLIGATMTDEYIAAIKATGMDWIPGGREVSALLTQLDPALNAIIRGYLLADEPDLIQPYDPPTTTRGWHTDIRRRDSSRPIMLGLSFNPIRNQGFTMLPVASHPRVSNQHWRDFAAQADVLWCDAYALAADDSYSPSNEEISGSGPAKFGIWTYPIQIRRMKELNDAGAPVWGLVETTSEVPNAPSADLVVKATWSQLIAGATGIVFFDHRFPTASVSQDFAAMLSNPSMKAAVTSLTAQLQALGPALLAAPASLVTSVASSGVLALPKGGLTAGAKVPIHYTSRQAGGKNHVFAQSIRPGATTGTFTVPSAASKTLEVIGEGRNVVANGSGVFTDSFAADYTVHLYRWTP